MSGAERNLKHTKGRREAGKCARQGCDEESGDFYLCTVCREAMRLYMRDYRRRRKEAARAGRSEAA